MQIHDSAVPSAHRVVGARHRIKELRWDSSSALATNHLRKCHLAFVATEAFVLNEALFVKANFATAKRIYDGHQRCQTESEIGGSTPMSEHGSISVSAKGCLSIRMKHSAAA